MSSRMALPRVQQLILAKRTEYRIYVKNTAYNWISAYDSAPSMTGKNGEIHSATGFNELFLVSENAKYYSLGLLNSTWGYLVWAIVGDGFHVTSRCLSFLERILDLLSEEEKDRLISLTQSMMNECKKNLRIKHNAGWAVENYSVLTDSYEVNEIDRMIARVLGLENDDIIKLHQWYHSQVSCGRDE